MLSAEQLEYKEAVATDRILKLIPEDLIKPTFESAGIVLTGSNYAKRNMQARRCVKILSKYGYKLASKIPVDPECIELSADGICRVHCTMRHVIGVNKWLNIADLGADVNTNRLKLIYILAALLPVMFVLGFLLG